MVTRHYVLGQGGRIHEFTTTESQQVARGSAQLPQFASTRIRYLQVAVTENDEDSEKSIAVHMAGAYLSFDDGGQLVEVSGQTVDEEYLTAFEQETCAQLALSDRLDHQLQMH